MAARICLPDCWNGDRANLLARGEETPLSSPLLGRVGAWSGYSTACAGDGWAAVGDAACCFDPLSSQGLFNALYGALKLAPAIAADLAGDWHPLSDYAGRRDNIWAAYQRHYRACYRQERRWADRAFWRRRHVPE